MNVRKLLDWRKLLIYSHRWMGIAFGLVFVSWFVSGIAFMYWGMPQVSREERLERQDPIDLSGAVLEPAGIAESRGIGVSSLAIEMRDGRPVFRIGPTPVFADTGESVQKRVNANIAVDIVRRWAPEHARTARLDARMEEPDQWTLQSAQRSQLPFYRIALDDPAATYYYVAEDTGEIVMKTDRGSTTIGAGTDRVPCPSTASATSTTTGRGCTSTRTRARSPPRRVRAGSTAGCMRLSTSSTSRSSMNGVRSGTSP